VLYAYLVENSALETLPRESTVPSSAHDLNRVSATDHSSPPQCEDQQELVELMPNATLERAGPYLEHVSPTLFETHPPPSSVGSDSATPGLVAVCERLMPQRSEHILREIQYDLENRVRYYRWEGPPLEHTNPKLLETYPPSSRPVGYDSGGCTMYLSGEYFVKLGVQKMEVEASLAAADCGVGPMVVDQGMYQGLGFLVLPKLSIQLAMQYPYAPENVQKAWSLYTTFYEKTGFSQRDPKAQNFMFDYDGRLYMIDYGNARRHNRPPAYPEKSLLLTSLFFGFEFGQNAWSHDWDIPHRYYGLFRIAAAMRISPPWGRGDIQDDVELATGLEYESQAVQNITTQIIRTLKQIQNDPTSPTPSLAAVRTLMRVQSVQ
jgi:hypothetical protein